MWFPMSGIPNGEAGQDLNQWLFYLQFQTINPYTKQKEGKSGM